MIKKYDVAIIGSWMGGSMPAAILARQGMDVIVFEAGQHPIFSPRRVFIRVFRNSIDNWRYFSYSLVRNARTERRSLEKNQ